MHERRHAPLAPRSVYLRRLAGHVTVAVSILAGTLGCGMAGYHWLEGLPWLDAFVNASMILGGMGPVAELHTAGGKLFAGCYALFAGVLFLVVVGVVVAPVVHRAMHRFHLDDDDTPPARTG